MDRDFRRCDAHVAAPYWGHDLVLTTQGKCFPNFKTRPCFKRYVLLQWHCMSDRVSDQCQHDFCSRTFFLIYSVRCVILQFLFAKPVPKTLNACVKYIPIWLVANNQDADDFRCHRAHYDITLMDRDFRRRDAHVAAPYWGHDLVLTTQGKCFPNFKTWPCFKRYVLLQWRCMSDRISDQCQHDFCSRNFFLIYSVRCVILPFLFAKPVQKTLNA